MSAIGGNLVGDVIHYLSDHKTSLMELIKIIRKVSQLNPYKGDDFVDMTYRLMWDEQCGINFPLLYISSLYVNQFAELNGCDSFLFTSRDCSHWIKVFRALFPEKSCDVHYFQGSRNMLNLATTTTNEHYNKYVASLVKTRVSNMVYIDIHGTCERILKYFEKHFGEVPYCFLMSTSYREYDDFPEIVRKYHKLGKVKALVFDARGSPIEMLNYDTIGTLQNYTERGSIRDVLEYPVQHLEAYHVAIDVAVANTQPIPSTGSVTLGLSTPQMDSLIRKIYRVIQDSRPNVREFVKHPSKHPVNIDGQK